MTAFGPTVIELANDPAPTDSTFSTRPDRQRLDFLTDLHNCDLLVLDDFLTIPVTGHTAAGLLNMLAASRKGHRIAGCR